MTRAVQAMGQRDYAGAAALLRVVLAASPSSLEAHYRLAVCASFLDLPQEAEREFEWVIAHGRGDSSEVRIAREWLASRRHDLVATPTAETASPSTPDRATLSGQVIIDEGGRLTPRPYHRLFLKGLPGTRVQDEFYRVQTDGEGNYVVAGIVPGDYRLTDRTAGTPGWRLRVTLKGGDTVHLDLTPGNSVGARDDFPGAS